MNRQQMEIYATVLLKKGINLQENQMLVINAPVESMTLFQSWLKKHMSQELPK